MKPHQKLIWLHPGSDEGQNSRRNLAYAFNAGRQAYMDGELDPDDPQGTDYGRFNIQETRCFKAGYWAGDAGLPPILVALYGEDP